MAINQPNHGDGFNRRSLDRIRERVGYLGIVILKFEEAGRN